jgi:hypothetical protein
MTDTPKNSNASGTPADDAKARMLAALEKKKHGNSGAGSGGPSSGSKVAGQAAANAPKMFRRKSGSA